MNVKDECIATQIASHGVDIVKIVDNICINCEKISTCKEKYYLKNCKKFKMSREA